ncbi:hypothetical protein M011DRAFT_403646 [Sporormia fimetaria CBS 119925]|uniref:Inheritance of peroxisomes protein 1 n=1 Tax=Sporormia fimetaria CBS 119925 TaxID=1340428 RepID=A0A6A6VCU3_9PLEO|nr:hypothetical protein M011DRAFT_403646 [Sporormia fimetaria CBS 119925]
MSSGSNAASRRYFTLPARLGPRPQPSITSSAASDGIETLFTCPSCKIVSFTASNTSGSASGTQRLAARDAENPASFSYKSSTERTLAVGALRIYRVTASNVSFLNSGNLLHTIFPRSQCWCVDNQSTFVLRIRQDSYYRIELRYDTDEDKQKAEDLKKVLAQVLHYEKKRCPFTRDFEVELPDRPPTPPRPRTASRVPPEKAKKWLFDKTWMPEGGPRSSTPVRDAVYPRTRSPSLASATGHDTVVSGNSKHSEERPLAPPTIQRRPAPSPSVRERAKSFQAQLSTTAPLRPHATPLPSISPKVTASKPETDSTPDHTPNEPQETMETLSLVSSTESFQTASPRSPSPEFVDAEAELINPWAEDLKPKAEGQEEKDRGRTRHRKQLSDITVKPAQSPTQENASPHSPATSDSIKTPTIPVPIRSAPSTPPLTNDSDSETPSLHTTPSISTPPTAIPLKRLTGASQKRAFSPLPNSQNNFRPSTSHAPSKVFTAAFVRKTCELLLGPPAHLVTLMLKIAAKISAGATDALRFRTYRVRHKEGMPGEWESSDGEGDFDEDDFGIPLRNLSDASVGAEGGVKRRGYEREVE